MARFEVQISSYVDEKVAQDFGVDRSALGRPSLYDFESGPMAAALVAFSKFDDLALAAGPSVRSVTVVDPFFGVIAFTGVLVEPGIVEVADVSIDLTFWDYVDEDPAD